MILHNWIIMKSSNLNIDKIYNFACSLRVKFLPVFVPIQKIKLCKIKIGWRKESKPVTLLLFFFSLRQPLTKNQILNIKCQLTFFDIVTIRKEKGQPGLIPFKIVTIAKKHWLTFGVSYLVFSLPHMQWKEHLCNVFLNSILVNKCYTLFQV